jgi:hypothetical protein
MITNVGADVWRESDVSFSPGGALAAPVRLRDRTAST